MDLVPREQNVVDPLIRELDAHIKGFRHGRTVHEISDRRLERLGRLPESVHEGKPARPLGPARMGDEGLSDIIRTEGGLRRS